MDQTDEEWRLIDWAMGDDGDIGALTFGNDPLRGRGLCAGRDLSLGESVVLLPWNRVITSSTAMVRLEFYERARGSGVIPTGIASVRHRLLSEVQSELHRWTLEMSLLVLSECRNPESSLRAWTCLLPSRPGSVFASVVPAGPNATDLLFLGPRGVEALARVDGALAKDVVAEQRWLRAAYQSFLVPDMEQEASNPAADSGAPRECCWAGCVRKGPPGSPLRFCPYHRAPLVSFASFVWAFVLVRSRAMELEGGGARAASPPPPPPSAKAGASEKAHAPTGISRCILPLIDMCNHSSSCAGVRLESGSDGVSLVTSSPHKQGHPLLLNYGEDRAAELVRTFGFVPRQGDSTLRFALSAPPEGHTPPPPPPTPDAAPAAPAPCAPAVHVGETSEEGEGTEDRALAKMLLQLCRIPTHGKFSLVEELVIVADICPESQGMEKSPYRLTKVQLSGVFLDRSSPHAPDAPEPAPCPCLRICYFVDKSRGGSAAAPLVVACSSETEEEVQVLGVDDHLRACLALRLSLKSRAALAAMQSGCLVGSPDAGARLLARGERKAEREQTRDHDGEYREAEINDEDEDASALVVAYGDLRVSTLREALSGILPDIDST